MYPAHIGLFDLIALLRSHCTLIPSFISHYDAYIAEASPCIVFMLANFIVLAIFLTSNKPPKADPCRRQPSSPSSAPVYRSKSPRRHPLNEGQSHAAAKAPTSYGALEFFENPNESLILSPHSVVEDKAAAVGSCPRRPICIGDGGLQLIAASPVSPNKTLGLDSGHGGGKDQRVPAEIVQSPSHDDLDKKFNQYINSFFARLRAESD